MMEKYACYKFFKEKRLIIEYFSGEFSIDDIILVQTKITSEPEYSSCYDTVMDLRDCVYIDFKSNLDRYIETIKNIPQLHQNRKAAYITKTPNQVVIMMLFTELVMKNELVINTNIFSSISAVASWFYNKNISSKFISNVIQELKMKPSII